MSMPEIHESEIRQRRRRLHAAMVELETALTAAAGRPREWQEAVTSALERFHSTIQDHVAKTERSDGLFVQIIDEAPRLEAKIGRLRAEHVDLLEGTEKLRARCREAVLDEDEIESLRHDAVGLIALAAHHRQRGSDLLYEAYQVDVAAVD